MPLNRKKNNVLRGEIKMIFFNEEELSSNKDTEFKKYLISHIQDTLLSKAMVVVLLMLTNMDLLML